MSDKKKNDPHQVIVQVPDHIYDVFSKSTCIYSRSYIDDGLDKMATAMSYKLSASNPIFLCVLVGGIIPLGNLLPRLNFPLQVDYIHATRYRGSVVGGDLQIKAEPKMDLKDRVVVIVDDILDDGITLQAIIDYCLDKKVHKVYTAVMVDKIRPRKKTAVQNADFSGLKVDNHFLFGYGLDYGNYLRNAPGIYMVAPEHEK
jgi:hypoxanthine phosphoribosyltransferase